MGKNQEEQGSVKLPTAEFAKVRKAVQDAVTANLEHVFTLTQQFWQGLDARTKADADAYALAESAFCSQIAQRMYRDPYDHSRPVVNEVSLALRYNQPKTKPGRVSRASLHFPTNRTTEFRVDDATIRFDKATSTVEVDVEGPWAVRDFHDHPVGKAFFAALKAVRWTGKQTGGVITGNDESNREDDSWGGGANWVASAWGPVGMAEAPGQCVPFTDSKGRTFRKADLDEAERKMRRRQALATARMYR